MSQVTQMEFILLAVIASILVLGLAALSFGVDSRPAFRDTRVTDRWTLGS